ncbi:MFS general substrate transporter [Mycena albidolilacea]|uniref:MFS general substrate transporter n=1 Tax=Mycena albidolilacea TaxID=1033008 RepID=A0AAD7ED45_9AGAR|nr:MFS general substrate transporter [Mycena albidolilacea]
MDEARNTLKIITAAGGNDKPREAFHTQPEFDEGGLRGWLAVTGGSLVLMGTFGNIQSFGVFQDFYTRTYFPREAPSTISWIGSLQLALQFLVGVVSGKLFDIGYFHLLMISGSLLYTFSAFMLSLVQPHNFYQALLAQGFGMGIASGMLFLPSLGLASHYFRHRRAVAIGIMVSSGALGGIIYSVLLNNILPREGWGFPWAVRFVAFINLFLFIIGNLIMKPRHLERSSDPVDMKQIWTDGAYWIAVAGLCLGNLGLFVPYFYLQLFSFIRGVDEKFLVWVIPILNAGAVAGRLMPSFLADRYGPANIIIPCGLLSGTIMWALLSVRSIASVTIFALIYGFTSGAYISLSTPTIAAFSSSPNDIGLRIGIFCFFLGLSLLGGNPMAGALLSAPEYVWWRPLTLGSVTLLVGTALVLCARQALVQRRGGNRLV